VTNLPENHQNSSRRLPLTLGGAFQRAGAGTAEPSSDIPVLMSLQCDYLHHQQ
jgi:hypothetical protein